MPVVPEPGAVAQAAERIDGAGTSRCSSGTARATLATEILELADRLAAPMVLTLKAKAGLEADNPYAVGQSGLIGNPAAQHALTAATCC